MAKNKKTMPHLSSYAIDPERIERKANEMAKEGWLLEKFGSLLSTYRRGRAGEYEYRVQVKEAGMDRLTYVAELAEFGIEEVGGVGDLLVLRKKADGTPFDLYSDLDSLIAQQKKSRALPARGPDRELFLGKHDADECVDNADECKRDRTVRGRGYDRL